LTSDAFGNADIKVPFFSPYIDELDKKTVNIALRSTLLTDGPKLREFESKFAKFTGAKYAVGVSNATAALHISLKALGIGKGDEVIVPDMTFVATANAVLLTGATPVIVDVDKSDMNMSITSLKKSITSKTKAILPVHFAGKICQINQMQKIVKSNDLFLIEDCAHAIGTKLHGRHVGTFGDAGCFSFYPTKNITTLEGGMIITNRKKIVDFARSARNHGITKSLSQRYTSKTPWNYDIIEPGYNYRLDEIRSSLGLSQLKKLTYLNQLRKKAFDYYNEKLSGREGVEIPLESIPGGHSFHLYIIKVKKEFCISRDDLYMKFLKAGIRTTVHYKPLHMFSIMKKKAKIYDKLLNSKQIFQQILSLPLYPQISKKQQDSVIDVILSN
jgi:perosamine synthetase